MPNVALHKPVEGAQNLRRAPDGPPEATDGNVTNYGSYEGWSHFRWPGHLTVDLESIQVITCIRFLLYDKQAERRYKYRLLTSEDGKNWDVLFDTGEMGRLGWQVFWMPPKGLRAQFVQIHGLWNSVRPEFHVVQVEVYDDEPPQLDATNINLQVGVILRQLMIEADQTMDIERQYKKVRSMIERSERKNPGFTPPFFLNTLEQLRPRVRDIADVLRSVIGIRREITKQIERELRSSKRLNIVLSFLAILLTALGLYFGDQLRKSVLDTEQRINALIEKVEVGVDGE